MAELYEIACRDQPDARSGELAARARREPAARGKREFFTTSTDSGRSHVPFVHVTSPGGRSRPSPERRPLSPLAENAGPCAPDTPPADTPAATAPELGAWSGTTIIEFGTGAAGPIAVRYFAEHGAKVIRIESRTRPDFLRTYGSNGPARARGVRHVRLPQRRQARGHPQPEAPRRGNSIAKQAHRSRRTRSPRTSRRGR